MPLKQSIRDKVLSLPGVRQLRKALNNQNERDEFVIAELKSLPPGSLLLDAGSGSQIYRKECGHLNYKAQDFAQYTTDTKKMLGTSGIGGDTGYQYGPLDYVGNIWAIDEKPATFDAVLCTEVLEHIPYPNDTIKELSRILKPGGTLILTAPSNCLRHMDPYFFYSGFSDRWYETLLAENGFKIEILAPVGDYYSWLAVELTRTARANSIFAKLILLPAFIYYFSKKKTKLSVDTLCMGYHILAKKLPR